MQRSRASAWLLLLALGVLAALAHQLIVQAHCRAEAAVLAPFQYLELVSASVLGWIVFGNVPGAMTWLGAGIIVLSGLLVVRAARTP